ncbi:hypothetical protein EV363DRAFT_957411 [Boletus edulis]|nr:hypothetical protein EV363DRAFT_957411 [Boletus edulis]
MLAWERLPTVNDDSDAPPALRSYHASAVSHIPRFTSASGRLATDTCYTSRLVSPRIVHPRWKNEGSYSPGDYSRPTNGAVCGSETSSSETKHAMHVQGHKYKEIGCKNPVYRIYACSLLVQKPQNETNPTLVTKCHVDRTLNALNVDEL